jgi:hypothetical protein
VIAPAVAHELRIHTCSTCERARINSGGNLHCGLIERPVPLTGSCSAHPKRRPAMKTVCAWCRAKGVVTILHGSADDPETSDGICPSCKAEEVARFRAIFSDQVAGQVPDLIPARPRPIAILHHGIETEPRREALEGRTE